MVAGYDEHDWRIDGFEHGDDRAEFVQFGLFGDVSAVDDDVCAGGDRLLQTFSMGIGEHKDSCRDVFHLVETA